MGILDRWLGWVKAWIDRHEKPPKLEHPMDCKICGDFGLYPFRGEKFTEWYCETCRPPFFQKHPVTLAGDPR
jgi:hypothetical protein